MLSAAEIRKKFFRFYQQRGHQLIPSASLLPENDPSILFTNSGMSPLVPYLLGEEHPAGKRLVNCQKCFRAEDIEEVGDGRHTTFFEMLGNWSLGDYFKEEQLNWWWEFLTQELKLNPQRLYQSIYAGSEGIPADQEAENILKRIYQKFGVKAEKFPFNWTEEKELKEEIDFSRFKIFAYQKKNWWQRGEAIGELGGPDSETFFDTGREHRKEFGEHCHVNCDCGRFLEIGNSVFMQYQKTATGWQPLKNKNVDFGGGLERLAMVVQGKQTIFQTDLFLPLIKKIEDLSQKEYFSDQKSFEVIADHLKAATFLMGDERGVAPSNTEQGYIVRRLIRRAIRYGRRLGIRQSGWPILLAQETVFLYQDVYPELKRNFSFIESNLLQEEEKFSRTLERGLKELEKLSSQKELDGEDAFNLFQTYGFPLEMTEEELVKKGKKILQREKFALALKRHQELSRAATQKIFKGGLADQSEATARLHTAAHLLLAALRQVLGDHVFQKGSNITAERLRFDFSHGQKLTPEEKQKVEDLVNKAIQADWPVICEELPLEEARQQGAMGVFGAKYGEKVKVYKIGEKGQKPFSFEICGGPHASRTGELGRFKIVKEKSSGAGVRRIKAILE